MSLITLSRTQSRAYLRDLCAEVLVLLGVLEEVDKLHDFNLRLVASSHVTESHTNRRVLIEHLGRRLAKPKRPLPA